MNSKFINLILKNKILFLLIILTILIQNNLIAQGVGIETPPPTDPSCYTNVYGCNSWSEWSDWIVFTYPSGYDDGCRIYVSYKTRSCINDPTNIEIWIGAIGVDPGSGCCCTQTSSAFRSNPTLWQMISYRKTAYHEFQTVTMQHRCNADPPEPPLKYSMRWPGSCTFKCIYADQEYPDSTAHWSVSGDRPCYDNGYCCGKTYILCWDEQGNQIVETNEITIGENHNCNWPTGDPPMWLCINPQGENGWWLQGATNCVDNCEYAGQ